MEAASPAPGRPVPPPPEPDPPARLDLGAHFPPADRASWADRARAVLVRAGAAPDVDPVEALTRRDVDGIPVPPLFLREDAAGLPPAVPGRAGAWDVRVRHDDPDPARSNAAVLADLAGGATSLWLRTGADAIDTGDLAAVLAGVHLDMIGVVLDAGPATAEATAALAAVAEGVPLRGSAGADPIGLAFRTGRPDLATTPVPRPTGAAAGLRPVTVDATAYHDAGASDVDELAAATAAGVAHLRALDGDLDALEFRFAVTDRQFPSIAKLRAARRLWARVAELCGRPDAVQVQHAVGSAAMATVRDPWANMLRGTVAAFAAAAGGADAVTVAPFDAAVGRPDAAARRSARNVQAILHDEASLARVADPAAGSWYVEWLTDRLAQRAWDRFTAIERGGGIVAALQDGSLRAGIDAAARERARRVATRDRPITGVSAFPDLAEARLDRPRAAAVPGVTRLAEPFEALRARSDRALAEDGARPEVVLLSLGPRTAHGARVAFATDLFRTGGFEVRVVDDAAAGHAAVVCLCASDAGYGDGGAAAAAAARHAGARLVWLAGRADVDGVDGTVFAGCDVLEVLNRTWAAVAAEVRA